MKTLVQENKSIENNSHNSDDVLDNLIERVTNNLAKLKNKDYLLEYLVKIGLSTDLAKKMIEEKNIKL